MSGRNITYAAAAKIKKEIRTPELTTLGASAKGWIRQADKRSAESEIHSYLSKERMEWIEGAGGAIVNSRLFTTEDIAMVTFEEFRVFCEAYGLNPYEEAIRIDRAAYLKMQIADYILNNNDRHEQNWGFLMENASGKLIGYCPLFDHDHAFSSNPNVLSQTRENEMTLFQAACLAQSELRVDLDGMEDMRRPKFLTEEQWQLVLERKRKLENE